MQPESRCLYELSECLKVFVFKWLVEVFVLPFPAVSHKPFRRQYSLIAGWTNAVFTLDVITVLLSSTPIGRCRSGEDQREIYPRLKRENNLHVKSLSKLLDLLGRFFYLLAMLCDVQDGSAAHVRLRDTIDEPSPPHFVMYAVNSKRVIQ
jgi:NADH:ubiquinone oxidoreductase subunit 4 (subunit M)